MSSNYPEKNTKRLGQAMIASGFVLGLLLLTTLFDGFLEHARNPNSNPESTINAFGETEITLESNRQGQYVVTGYVNDVATQFILDTGATDVVIPPSLAQASGLEYGYKSQAMTANGLVSIYSTVIKELRIGSITLKNVRASINPAMHESMVLLGMSALGQVEMYQQGSRLTLKYNN